MPNWCSTDYYVVGSKKEVLDLNKKMERLENRKKSLVKNDFGNTWLGNLVNYLGGDWEKVIVVVNGCVGNMMRKIIPLHLLPKQHGEKWMSGESS